jgi:Holliday junction resolvase RusA-like endonuclease
MTEPFTLRLPLPPSTNALYRNVRGVGRVKTRKYNTWLNVAASYALVQKPHEGFPRFGRDFEVIVLIPAKTRGDVDNRAKATLDILTAWLIISDDRFATAVTIRRVLDMPADECRVTVRPSFTSTENVSAS